MESLAPEFRAMYEALKAETVDEFEKHFGEYQRAATATFKLLLNDTIAKIDETNERLDSVRSDIGELCQEMSHADFYDDTPYAEWAAALAVVEPHYGESTSVAASASFASTPDESPVVVIDIPPSTVVLRATTPAVGARTAVHEGDDDINFAAPSTPNSASAPLGPTSTRTPSRLVSEIQTVLPTRCSIECLDDDSTGEMLASAPSACSSTLKGLDDTAPPAATVLGRADADAIVAPQLSDASLKHYPVPRSFFVSERGAHATADNMQVRVLFLPTEDVFPTIIRHIAVSIIPFVLYDVRPLPCLHSWMVIMLEMRYCSCHVPCLLAFLEVTVRSILGHHLR